MLQVADVTKLLGRYGELVSMAGLLPLLSHVKFGNIGKQPVQPKEPKEGEAPVERQPETTSVPSAVSLILLMVAEICCMAQLFSPTDKTAVRAVGDIARAHKKSAKPGIMAVFESFIKLLQKDDIYVLVRLLAHVGALGGLAITVALRLHEQQPNSKSAGHPLRELYRAARSFFNVARTPHYWFLAMLGVTFVLGNWTALGKFFVRPGVLEAVQALGPLLRALGLGIATLGGQADGPMHTWAATCFAGSFVRATRLYMYERVPWEKLMSDGLMKPGGLGAGASASIATLQGNLAMEALCGLLTIPAVIRKPKVVLFTGLLCMLPAAAIDGGKAMKVIETYLVPLGVADTLHKLAIAVCVVSLFLIFSGGILTMTSFIFLLQLLSHIHRFDKLKI